MKGHEVAILEEWMEEALQSGDYDRYKKLSIDWVVVLIDFLGIS